MFTSRDGLEIPGFLFRPRGASAERRVPAIVYPHGGPTDAYMDNWDGHAQYFVDKGYAWLAVNFRGSTGYGREFERANHGVWGVKDTWDCLAAADHLRTLDWVDGDRLGIFGASYGSYMALLSVTDDPEHRFRCAVAKYGDCDILTSWAQGDREGVQDLERMMGHAGDRARGRTAPAPPSTGSRTSRAPLLIAHGERDERVSPKQSEELVAGLRRAGKTFEYITYPTEAHGLLRAGTAVALLPAARALPRLVPDVALPLDEIVQTTLGVRRRIGNDRNPQSLEEGRVRRIGGIVAAGVVAAGLVLAGSGGSASGQDGKPLVFTVGYTQDIDSMNVAVGVTVAAFEAWNIQYATLTDKAAKDFSVTPGLAESWEGSEDGKTWTYHLHPNMKWSDGKPLTSEDVVYTLNRSRKEEWLNHSAIVANITASAPDPDTVVIKSSVPDPEAAGDGRLHRPEAHLREVRREGAAQVRRAGRRRLGAVHAGGVQEGPVRALQGQPELLAREARARRRRDPQLQQRGRDGRRAAER